MDNQTCSFWVEFTKLALPSFLVIVGWIAVNKLTVKREVDKSRRDMIAESADELCAAVDKLFEFANDYHSSERDNKLEIKIKITLNDLSQRVSSLVQITTDIKTVTNCLMFVVKLRQAVSGKHFEDEHLGPISNSNIHEEIADASLAMKRCLFELKYSQFSLHTSAS